jgi:hypothetical protein
MLVFFRSLILYAILGISFQSAFAQDSVDVISVKCKAQLFRGSWQLTKTFSRGTYHTVAKADFNDVIQFKAHHNFTEEVYYESNHWIIAGKWFLDKKHRVLSLTHRNYVAGKLENHPADLVFNIVLLDKQNWGGSSTDKGQIGKVYYTRVP